MSVDNKFTIDGRSAAFKKVLEAPCGEQRELARLSVLDGTACAEEQASGNGPCGVCVTCYRRIIEEYETALAAIIRKCGQNETVINLASDAIGRTFWEKPQQKDEHEAMMLELQIKEAERNATTQCKLYDALDISRHAMSGREAARMLLREAGITAEEIFQSALDSEQKLRLEELIKSEETL